MFKPPRKIRKGIKYPAKDIMELVHNFATHKKKRLFLDGDLVTLHNMKIRTFKRSGLVCACCGLEGTYFVKEKVRANSNDPFHLSLYGTDFWGFEQELTSDHIHPQGKGGSVK